MMKCKHCREKIVFDERNKQWIHILHKTINCKKGKAEPEEINGKV